MSNQSEHAPNSSPRPNPATTQFKRVVVAGFAVVVTVLGIACWGRWWSSPKLIEAPRVKPSASEVKHPPKPPRPDEGYVGSSVCATCHPQIAERYQLTAMGRSLANVADASAPHEDYDQRTSFEKGNCSYRVEREDDRVWHHEILSDGEGVIYDQAEEIQFAMGSNTRGRSYLFWREGYMFISPIAWYSNDGWDLSPGYAPGRHQRFSRRATDACVACHCGRPAREESRQHYFPQPVFHELSIGCERCHGPGRGHIEFRQQAAVNGQDPIVDLKRLPSPQRDAVCYQCHFQGEDRFLRYGREEFDFRPGMKISDVWTVFVRGDGADGDSTAVVSQAMQMEASRCYRQSAGRMGCVSCHDPHDSPQHDQRGEFYNRRCLQCHEDRGCSASIAVQQNAPANGSCTYCHMPSRSAKVIPHTSQTDHRIPRAPGAGLRTPPHVEWTIFEDDIAKLSAGERARAMGLMLLRRKEGQQDQRITMECVNLLSQARTSMPDDEPTMLALGEAFALLGRPREAEAVWRKRLEQSPYDEWAIVRLANAAHESGRFPEADQLFSQSVKINPWQAFTHARHAHVLGKLNRLDEAIDEANRAVVLDPSMFPIYMWLSDAYAIRGDDEQSRRFKRLGERLSKAAARK